MKLSTLPGPKPSALHALRAFAIGAGVPFATEGISAAMELAKATVMVSECEAPTNSVVHDYDRAARRVLQAWREE